MTHSIILDQVTKSYKLPAQNRPWTLQEAVVRGFRGVRSKQNFTALNQISFSVLPGKMVGIIGANGAGKSTLLRLIGGVGLPDSGQIQVDGRIGALLDLGVGFHPELTGRENIFINGVISGLTRAEVAQRIDSIIEFAELSNFIDSPLRTYSSGMQMRLAFSVSTHIEPEILLIDEVLAVGDMRFQNKCLDRIHKFKHDGCTILFVSHDLARVKEFCDEVVWLQSGKLIAHDKVETVVNDYAHWMKSNPSVPGEFSQGDYHSLLPGSFQKEQDHSPSIIINGVNLLDQHELPLAAIMAGEALRIEIDYSVLQPVDSPNFGISITQADNQIYFESHINLSELQSQPIQGKGKVALDIDRLDLKGGRYFVDAWIYPADWQHAYDYHWHRYPLIIQSNLDQKGYLDPPHEWHLPEDA